MNGDYSMKKTPQKELIDRHMNMILDNRRLSMSPPIFQTSIERAKSRRFHKAVKAEISVGGKFFCRHDYTFLETSQPDKNIFDWKYLYSCVKCGKRKLFRDLQIEPFITPNPKQ